MHFNTSLQSDLQVPAKSNFEYQRKASLFRIKKQKKKKKKKTNKKKQQFERIKDAHCKKKNK